MRSRGIFCFALVLVFAESLIVLGSISALGAQKTGAALEYAMQIEAANAARAEIEQGIDFIVSETMRKELASGERDSGIIKEKVVSAILGFIAEGRVLGKAGLRIRFHSIEGHFGGAGPLAEPGRHADVNAGILQKNSNVLVLSPKEHVFIAEFTYGGGIMKNEFLYATIEAENFTQVFLLPAGYTRRAVVLA